MKERGTFRHLRSWSKRRAERSSGEEWELEVLRHMERVVLEAYEDVCKSVEEVDASLQWLSRSEDQADSKLSDTDKICRQMVLDLREFAWRVVSLQRRLGSEDGKAEAPRQEEALKEVLRRSESGYRDVFKRMSKLSRLVREEDWE